MNEKCEIWVLTEDGWHRMIFDSYEQAQYIQKNLRSIEDDYKFGEW